MQASGQGLQLDTRTHAAAGGGAASGEAWDPPDSALC